MSLAIGLENICPGSHYQGSLTSDTREAYDAIIWLDSRVKPSYDAVLVAAGSVQKDYLKQYAAKLRYKRQRKGFTYQGMHFDADANSINALTMAYSLAQANSSYHAQWKLENNTFTSLSAPKIIGLYGAVTTFVQALFTAESVIHAAVDAGSVTRLEDVFSAINSVPNAS